MTTEARQVRARRIKHLRTGSSGEAFVFVGMMQVRALLEKTSIKSMGCEGRGDIPGRWSGWIETVMTPDGSSTSKGDIPGRWSGWIETSSVASVHPPASGDIPGRWSGWIETSQCVGQGYRI